MIFSFGETFLRSVARSRPFCPGRTTSVSSNRTMVLHSSNTEIFRRGSSFQHSIAGGLENLASHLAEEAFIFH